jgi:hypothetical protein
MILTAKLFIEGHETEQEGIPLNSCDFTFEQDVDQKGLPISGVKGGTINVEFASFDDPDIIWWMMSASSDKNGKIVFAGIEAGKAYKTLEFKDGRCVKYHESFSRDAEMTVELSISAREITVSGATHSNSWWGYDKGKGGGGKDN